MLVLSRKAGERIVIGDELVVTVLESTGGRIRLGIDAPKSVKILRGELANTTSPRPSLGSAVAELENQR